MPATAPPRAMHWVIAGCLFAVSLFLFIIGVSSAALSEVAERVDPVYGRGALVLSMITCTVAVGLCNRFCQQKHAAEADEHTHELLAQVAAKMDDFAASLADVAKRVEEYQWDVFGEAAIAVSDATVTPLTRRPGGRDRR